MKTAVPTSEAAAAKAPPEAAAAKAARKKTIPPKRATIRDALIMAVSILRFILGSLSCSGTES
jgi:hypothetical protein